MCELVPLPYPCSGDPIHIYKSFHKLHQFECKVGAAFQTVKSIAVKFSPFSCKSLDKLLQFKCKVSATVNFLHCTDFALKLQQLNQFLGSIICFTFVPLTTTSTTFESFASNILYFLQFLMLFIIFLWFCRVLPWFLCSWLLFGTLGAVLDAFSTFWEGSWPPLGPSGLTLGRLLGPLGTLLGPLGTLLEPLRDLLH